MFRQIKRRTAIAREEDTVYNPEGKNNTPVSGDDSTTAARHDYIDDMVLDAKIAREEEELEQLTQDIEVAEAGRARLERVRTRLEETVETGGMSPIEADLADVAIGTGLNEIGYDVDGDEPVIPATEEYLADPMQATKLAIESLSDKIKHAGNVIWDGIRKFFVHIKKVFTSILDLLLRVKDKMAGIDKQKKVTIDDMSTYNPKFYNLIIEKDGSIDTKKLTKEILSTVELLNKCADTTNAYFKETLDLLDFALKVDNELDLKKLSGKYHDTDLESIKKEANEKINSSMLGALKHITDFLNKNGVPTSVNGRDGNAFSFDIAGSCKIDVYQSGEGLDTNFGVGDITKSFPVPKVEGLDIITGGLLDILSNCEALVNNADLLAPGFIDLGNTISRYKINNSVMHNHNSLSGPLANEIKHTLTGSTILLHKKILVHLLKLLRSVKNLLEIINEQNIIDDDLDIFPDNIKELVKKYTTTANKDPDKLRKALTIEIEDRKKTKDELRAFGRKLYRLVPDLFEDYEVTSSAKEIDNARSNWTRDYLDKCFVYLDANFSEKRYLHLINVRSHLLSDE